MLRGRYELVSLLNEHPLFALYAGRDRVLGKDVSIRLIREPFSRESEFIDHLRELTKKYQSIRNINIESMYDLDEEEGTYYIIGDLTRKPTLADRIRTLTMFSSSVAVSTAMSLCKSVEVLHRANVIHGGLIPANVCVLPDGDVCLQLGGFWEAYVGSDTAGAIALPSLAPYLAPECGAGQMPSAGSDVYAIGIMLFEMLTGHPPYIGATAVATALLHTTEATPSARAANSTVHPVLDEITKKAMAKDPSERYKNAIELYGDLRMLQDALRFGRNLTWPLRGNEPEAAPTPAVSSNSKNVGTVAPRMSAIRDPEVESKTKEKKERDVPVWLVLAVVFFGMVAVGLFGGVYLFLNFSKPRMVTVPNMKGLSFSEAQALTEKIHITLRIGSRVANDRVEQDKIIELSPIPGAHVREGGEVVVTVSTGPTQVQVPDVTGFTPDKAKSVLSNLGLKVSKTVEYSYRPDMAAGLIISQTPEAQQKVSRDSEVKLILNSDHPTEPAEPQPAMFTLNINLSKLTEPTEVKVELEDAAGVSEVHRQIHEPGDSISLREQGVGTSAKFKIYYNDELVQTVTRPAQKSDQ